MPPPPSHLPRLARRRRCPRQRTRSKALPIPASLANRPRHNFHRLHICARLRSLAAHRLCGSLHHRTRSRKWQRQERSGDYSYGVRMVRLRAADHRYDRVASYDIEYQGVGRDVQLVQEGTTKVMIGRKERSSLIPFQRA